MGSPRLAMWQVLPMQTSSHILGMLNSPREFPGHPQELDIHRASLVGCVRNAKRRIQAAQEDLEGRMSLRAILGSTPCATT